MTAAFRSPSCTQATMMTRMKSSKTLMEMALKRAMLLQLLDRKGCQKPMVTFTHGRGSVTDENADAECDAEMVILGGELTAALPKFMGSFVFHLVGVKCDAAIGRFWCRWLINQHIFLHDNQYIPAVRSIAG